MCMAALLRNQCVGVSLVPTTPFLFQTLLQSGSLTALTMPRRNYPGCVNQAHTLRSIACARAFFDRWYVAGEKKNPGYYSRGFDIVPGVAVCHRANSTSKMMIGIGIPKSQSRIGMTHSEPQSCRLHLKVWPSLTSCCRRAHQSR